MTAEEDARRLAAGPPPSDLVELGRRGPRASADRADPPHDPLQLCIFATIALLGWVLGPVALVVLAGVAFVGYRRARRAGLARSRCFLRDTRLVLLYLGALVVAGGVGAYLVAASLLGA
jgi:hypothetical protein